MDVSVTPLRRIELSLDIVIEEVRVHLYPYIGVVSDIADHTGLLLSALNEILGSPETATIEQLLEPYSLPSETKAKVRSVLVRRTYAVLMRCFGYLYPARKYIVTVTRYGSICIDECDHTPLPVVPDKELAWADETGWHPRRTR